MKKVKILFAVFLGVGILISAAWAVGINVHCAGVGGAGYAYNHSGTADSNKLATTSVLQWIIGAPGLPHPTKPNFLNSGTLSTSYSGNIGVGTGGTAGTFDINTGATGGSYIRVWENGGPATGNYYWTLGSYSVGDPLPSENYVSSFQTKYLADVPPSPTVATPNDWKLTYNASLTKYLPAFTLTAVAGASPLVEVNSWTLAIKKQADDWAAAKTYTSQSASIAETDPANPFFVAGSYYTARAKAGNFFGDSAWGAENSFQIPVGEGGPGGYSTFNFNILGVDATKLVINSIATPHTKTSAGAVSKASELKTVINTIAGEAVVVAISKWDPVAGTSITAAFDTGGTLIDGTTDFTITPGEGVQVYTTKAVSLSLVGQP